MTEERSESDGIVTSAAIYIHGKTLVPSHVTDALSVDPSDSWQRGDVRVSRSGQPSQKKKGMWTFGVHSKYEDIDRLIASLLSKFDGIKDKISGIEGIEDAYIDIFIACEKPVIVTLSKEILSSVAETGLPMIINFSP